jgi:hypothetical protein
MAVNNPKAIQATNGWVPTLSDTVNAAQDSATPTVNGFKYDNFMVYTGTGGIIKVTMVDGLDVTFNSVPAGVILPIVVKRVWSSTTTATGIVALIGRYGV